MGACITCFHERLYFVTYLMQFTYESHPFSSEYIMFYIKMALCKQEYFFYFFIFYFWCFPFISVFISFCLGFILLHENGSMQTRTFFFTFLGCFPLIIFSFVSFCLCFTLTIMQRSDWCSPIDFNFYMFHW